MKRPTLHCFDVDGTVAQLTDLDFRFSRNDVVSLDDFMQVKPHRNMLQIVTQAIETPNGEVMFCTGRPKDAYGVTWRWLNQHLRIADCGKRVSLVCRPNSVAIESTPQFKLAEMVQAIRRQPEKLAELRVYDDCVGNLRLLQTLRPMVTTLRLYRVEDGVATQWSM